MGTQEDLKLNNQRSEHTKAPKRADRPSNAVSVRGNFINSGLLSIIGLVTGFFVTRQIGAVDRGVYAFLMLFSTFLMPLLGLGVSTGFLYLISSKDFKIRDTLVSCCIFGTMHGWLTASIILALWFFELLGRTGNELSAAVLLPVIFSLPLRGTISAMEVALMADSQFTLVNSLLLLEAIITSVSMWTIVIFLDTGLQGIVLLMLIIPIVILAIGVLNCWRLYRPFVQIDFLFLRSATKYGIKSMLGFFSKRANLRLDQVILGFVASPAILGVYSVATMISEVAWKVENAIGSVFFNKIAETKDSAQKNKLLYRVIRLVTLTLIAISLPLIVLCHFLVPWALGTEFSEVTPILMILLPGTIVGSAFRILNRFFVATGSPWLMSLSETSAMTFALILYWPLIQLFGLMGAASASTVVYIIGTIASLYLLRKHYNASTTDLLSRGSTVEDLKWAYFQLRRSVGLAS
jgi:O-antigen/teichoic acid export membrane protein